jgi:hypothetical protein
MNSASNRNRKMRIALFYPGGVARVRLNNVRNAQFSCQTASITVHFSSPITKNP